jgi:hypothetical protein
MSIAVTTISLKIPVILKAQLTKKARTNKQTVSDYIRSMIIEKLETGVKKPSPFLDLVGTMGESEAKTINESISNNRQNRHQSYWQNLID